MSLPFVSSISAGARTALMGLLGLLVVILGCLIAFAFVIRGRPHAQAILGGEEDAPGEGQGDPNRLSEVYEVEDPMACPTCRREFVATLRFCPHDATRLVSAAQMLKQIQGKPRSRYVCPSCHRAYEGRVRFCPHDGRDLVPMAVYQATREPEHDHGHEHGDSMVAKICPECRGRYGYAATFCGKDGVELVVLN